MSLQTYALLASDFEAGRFIPVKPLRVFRSEKEAKLTRARPNALYLFSYKVRRPITRKQSKIVVGRMLREFRGRGLKVHYIGQQGSNLYVQVRTPKTLSYVALAVWGIIIVAITIWIFLTGASPQFRKGVEGVASGVGRVVEKGVTGVGKGIGAGIGEAAKSPAGLLLALGLAGVAVAGGAYVLTRRKR